MRDKGIYHFRRALPRMSWSPQNLYNLWQRTVGPKSKEIEFTQTMTETLFQQRWKSKAAVRAYHGDFIPESVFKRWYLPAYIPDVRPRRVTVAGDDKGSLEDFAMRKKKANELKHEEDAKGLAPVGSLMFSEVERRLDVFLFRCCFVHSVYEARRLVIHGNVKINGKKHSKANTRLAPGDLVSVDPKAIRFFKPQSAGYEDVSETGQTPFNLPFYASPWLFIPPYIEPSFATCSAVYVRHPTARPGYSEIPTPYEADGALVRYAWEWYMQRRTRLRSKTQLARMPEDRALGHMEEDVQGGRHAKRADMERIRRAVSKLRVE